MTEITHGMSHGEALIHIGFMLVALSHLVHDVVRLRMLSIAAYMVFAAAVVLIQSPAMAVLLAWYTVFVALACAMIVKIRRERRDDDMSEEERALHRLTFPALDVPNARRLMRLGRWLTLPAGHVLTLEGHQAIHVHLVLQGHVRVTIAGRPVALVGPGQFVGEIGLLAHGPATATAIAGSEDSDEPVRVLAWRLEDLDGEMARTPSMRFAVYAAIGPDLARKFASSNANLQRSAHVLANAA